MSVNKSFRTLTTSTAVMLLTFEMVACGGFTMESSGAASPTTTRTSTTLSGTKTPAPKSSGKFASEITNPQAERMDETPDGQMKLSEADDSYFRALGKMGIDVDRVEDRFINIGRATCADAPEEGHQIIALVIAGQLVAQDRSQDNVEEVAKIITSSTEKVYRQHSCVKC